MIDTLNINEESAHRMKKNFNLLARQSAQLFSPVRVHCFCWSGFASHQWVRLCWNRTPFPIRIARQITCHRMMIGSYKPTKAAEERMFLNCSLTEFCPRRKQWNRFGQKLGSCGTTNTRVTVKKLAIIISETKWRPNLLRKIGNSLRKDRVSP